MIRKVKILIVGPCEAGKTYLSNLFSYSIQSTNNRYTPTKLARILWFEVNGVPLGEKHSTDITVELWDCSGDEKFEICWPSMRKNANGIVFVYNPGIEAHLKELEKWHVHFAKRELGITDEQCVIFAHEKQGLAGRLKPGGILNEIHLVKSNMEEDPSSIQNHFKNFLANVAVHADKRTNIPNHLLT